MDTATTITRIESALTDLSRETPNGEGKAIINDLLGYLRELALNANIKKCHGCGEWKHDSDYDSNSDDCDECHRAGDELRESDEYNYKSAKGGV